MDQLTKELVQSWIPTREKQSYKGKMGRILCVGGNKQMGGAILLASSAALYSGAGLVTVASAEETVHALHARTPECMFLNMYNTDELKDIIPTMDVIVVGPGLGHTEESLTVLKTVYEYATAEQHILVDGDAISLHVNHNLQNPEAHLIFTPHLGEWETLTGQSPDEENEEDNLYWKQKLDATIVLKKDRTQIYHDESVWENTTGNPSMATGGMGDTLAGMIAGFLGQYKDTEKAILSAVYLHSYIGDELAKASYVTLPSQMITHIPKFMKEFAEKS